MQKLRRREIYQKFDILLTANIPIDKFINGIEPTYYTEGATEEVTYIFDVSNFVPAIFDKTVGIVIGEKSFGDYTIPEKLILRHTKKASRTYGWTIENYMKRNKILEQLLRDVLIDIIYKNKK